MNNTPMKTETEIVVETVLFYGADLSRRAMMVTGEDGEQSCVYCDDLGRRCAVGRCCEHPKDVQSKYSSSKVHLVINGFGSDKFLKREYRGHTEAFWSQLQRLHDNDDFWDPDGICGLSGDGLDFVKDRFPEAATQLLAIDEPAVSP